MKRFPKLPGQLDADSGGLSLLVDHFEGRVFQFHADDELIGGLARATQRGNNQEDRQKQCCEKTGLRPVRVETERQSNASKPRHICEPLRFVLRACSIRLCALVKGRRSSSESFNHSPWLGSPADLATLPKYALSEMR